MNTVYRYIGFVALAVLSAIPLYSYAAIVNGANAIDAIGQYVNREGGEVSYTSSSENGGAGDMTPYGLNGPAQATLDASNHRLFVIDSGNNRVLVFNLNVSNQLVDKTPDFVLGQQGFYLRVEGTTQTMLKGPQGIAHDSGNNRLFVADTSNNRILVFDVTSITNGESAVNVLGQADFTSGTGTLAAGRLNIPYRLAYDSVNARLYVADTGNNRAVIYNTTSIVNGQAAANVLGQANFTTSSALASQNRMFAPQGIGINTSGTRAYVADTANHRVLVFDTTVITDGENAINVLGQPDFVSASDNITQDGMNQPNAIAHDAANNRLYVAESGGSGVKVFNIATITNGEPAVNILGQPDFESGSGFADTGVTSSPEGVYYDSTNNRTYVSDTGSNRIMIFDTTAITDGEDAIDAVGQSTYNDGLEVDYYTQDSNDGTQINPYGLSQPAGLAIDYTNHRLFLADGSRILVFNLNSSNILVDKTPDYVLGQQNFWDTSSGGFYGFSYAAGLVYDSGQNRLFVADADKQRVLVWNVSTIENGDAPVNVLGQANFSNITSACSASRLNNPSYLSLDPTGNRLFVSDRSNRRIVVFDIAGITNGESAINVLGQPDFVTCTVGTTQSKMDEATGVTYDAIQRRLFVSDGGNARVLVFDVADITNGESAINVLGQPDFVTANANGGQAGFGGEPNGLSYDEVYSRLFVADYSAARVLVFDVADITNGESAINVLGQPNFLNYSTAVTQSSIVDPIDLMIDSQNKRLYVSDEPANRTMIFDISVPTILNVASGNSDGSYTNGGTINILIQFSESVTVTGTPQLTLETGATDAVANYISGSGTDTLTFNYTVGPSDTSSDLDYASVGALNLNGGNITTTAQTAPVRLLLPSPGVAGSLSANKALIVYTPAPSVSSGGGGPSTPSCPSTHILTPTGCIKTPTSTILPPAITTTPISTTTPTGKVDWKSIQSMLRTLGYKTTITGRQNTTTTKAITDLHKKNNIPVETNILSNPFMTKLIELYNAKKTKKPTTYASGGEVLPTCTSAYKVIDSQLTPTQRDLYATTPGVSILTGAGIDLRGFSNVFDTEPTLPLHSDMLCHIQKLPPAVLAQACAALPATTISSSSSKTSITNLQRFIAYVLRGEVVIDGVYGRSSKAYVRLLQKRFNMAETGAYTPTLSAKIKVMVGCPK